MDHHVATAPRDDEIRIILSASGTPSKLRSLKIQVAILK